MGATKEKEEDEEEEEEEEEEEKVGGGEEEEEEQQQQQQQQEKEEEEEEIKTSILDVFLGVSLKRQKKYPTMLPFVVFIIIASANAFQNINLKLFQDSKSYPIYYRYLTVDEESDFLFVGAMNKLFGLNLQNIENKAQRISQDFRPSNSARDHCRNNGKLENFDCQGHIRFLTRLKDRTLRDTFYMCSTGSFKPTGYKLVLKQNSFNLVQSDLNAHGICSFGPNDNTTAVLVENGTPHDTPSLFGGAVKDFLQSAPVISRHAVYSSAASYVSTMKKIDWLNEPQFVGSFDVGDYVYFFYREVAIEYTNCGKKIFSRVARVCKNDEGSSLKKNTWVSFLKARLNCSIPGEYPFYFDEIQDVFKIRDMFYALFTTNVNGLTASAICGYNITNIDNAFEGSFKQGNSTSIWLPVPNNKVPNPRPGSCSRDSTRIQQEQFVSQHSMLMDRAVPHQFREPIFYKSNTLMRKLVVIPNVAGGDGMVFFTASNAGVIYKIAAWPKINPKYDPPTTYLVSKIIPLGDNKPIWGLVNHGNSIYFSTDTAVGQIPVETCDKYTKIDLCIYDPYCGWDTNLGECRIYSNSPSILPYKSIDLMSYSLEEAITKAVGGYLVKFERISRTTGSSVMFRVAYKLHIRGNVRWSKEGTPVRGDRHILAQDNSLIITDIRSADEGHYEAKDSNGRVVADYSLIVETNKEQIEQRWMRKFDQWCEEFERYQEDIRKWEKKCEACCEEPSKAKVMTALGGR
ncbi:semaphorin-2A [Elysia marginata]|uniref:Semaphorin-2A n=1 Tax=Elysia marginata TaxID=1093978 RepID=A0AAV4JHW5_9GAST|nr:semaphorin-2A [Elysia marginata]